MPVRPVVQVEPLLVPTQVEVEQPLVSTMAEAAE
jgi:hypothetical protein